MIKYAALEILSAEYGGEQPLRHLAHRADFEYSPRPGYLYVRSRAISSRCNDNYDDFPAEEIIKGYNSFIGKPVFVNHVNDDHKRARGVVIDAALHHDVNPNGTPDVWCEVLMEVDAIRFPKLAQAIVKGHIDKTSMGVDVEYSICSACGNRATNPAEYCRHIPQMKGSKIIRRNASTGRPEETLIFETCYGLSFFENSLLVEDPADPTAYFLGVDDRGLRMAHSAAVRAQEGLGAFVAMVDYSHPDEAGDEAWAGNVSEKPTDHGFADNGESWDAELAHTPKAQEPDRPTLDQKRPAWHQLPAQLHSKQNFLNSVVLDHFRSGGGVADEGPNTHPAIMKWRGKHYVDQGTHRLAIDKEHGNERYFGRYHDYDNPENKTPHEAGLGAFVATDPPLYHGTRWPLRAGQTLTPEKGQDRSSWGYGQGDGYVYTTSDHGAAREFAEDGMGPPGHPDAEPRVYQVEHTGPAERDTDEPNFASFKTKHPVKVIRRVSAYTPEPDAPEEGEYEKEPDPTGFYPGGIATRWRQAHKPLVADALQKWKGDPINALTHWHHELNDDPQPDSGSGKQMRAMSGALRWELQNNSKTFGRKLYRGVNTAEDLLPQVGDVIDHDSRPRGYSSNQSTARRFAGKPDRDFGRRSTVPVVYETAPGTKGLRVKDYNTGSGLDQSEQEYILHGQHEVTHVEPTERGLHVRTRLLEASKEAGLLAFVAALGPDEDLTNKSPGEIDQSLSEHHDKLDDHITNQARALVSMHHAVGDRQKYRGKQKVWGKTDEEVHNADPSTLQPWDQKNYASAKTRHSEAVQGAAEARDHINRHEDEFTRRGGWSRFFTVQDGHIHSSRACHSCRPTTRFGWQPELSGKSEKEAVDDKGPYLCTHCFKSAPVEWKRDPTEVKAEEKKKSGDVCEGGRASHYLSREEIDARKAAHPQNKITLEPGDAFYGGQRQGQIGKCPTCKSVQKVKNSGEFYNHKSPPPPKEKPVVMTPPREEERPELAHPPDEKLLLRHMRNEHKQKTNEIMRGRDTYGTSIEDQHRNSHDMPQGHPWMPNHTHPGMTGREAGLRAFVGSCPFELRVTAVEISVAGLAVVARDTGRVLMLQRSNHDDKDPAAGTWEFPGGHLDEGESPAEGAIREWKEELGCPLPPGQFGKSWLSKGMYQGHVYVIDHEDDVDINCSGDDRKVLNPDDPDGDQAEVAAWFDPKDLPKMPALRPECKNTDWSVLTPKAIEKVSGLGAFLAALEGTDYEGRTGDERHITRNESGDVPIDVVRHMPGVKGEVPGEHRNKRGAEWENFKADIAQNGIQRPIFITVDHGRQPRISEGSHRRDAAVELGHSHIPAEVRYFGHAEQQGTIEERHHRSRESALRLFVAVNSSDEVPPEAGTAPIPEGHIRLFHQTSEKNAESVREHGISMKHARDVSGPRGVWCSHGTRFYGDRQEGATVEFHVPYKELQDTAGGQSPHRHQPQEDYERSTHHTLILPRTIEPHEISAIHLPWHDRYRYFKNEGVTDEVKKGEYDHVNDIPDYAKAISKIKSEASRHLAMNTEDEIPPRLGTAPIPEGHVRLYHHTWSKNVPSIRQHGLMAEMAKGDSGKGYGNEASAGVWAASQHPEPDPQSDRHVVEFHAHPRDIDVNGPSPGQDVHKWQQGDHNVLMRGSIKPENILAIHAPWHTAYHQINDDPRDREDVKNGKLDWVHNDPSMPGVSKAVHKIQAEGAARPNIGKGWWLTPEGKKIGVYDHYETTPGMARGMIRPHMADSGQVRVRSYNNQLNVQTSRPFTSEQRHSLLMDADRHSRMFVDVLHPDTEESIHSESGGPEDADRMLDRAHRAAVPHTAKKTRNTEKPQQCKWGKHPATKSLLWAEGMAYIPTCDAHEQKTRDHIENHEHDEVVAVHTIRKEAIEAHPDSYRTLYRGLHFGEIEPHKIDDFHKDPQKYMRENQPKNVGIHWTDSADSAYNFATNRDPEGWAHEGDPDEEQGHLHGAILEARVHPRHIIDPESEEGQDYAMSDAILGPEHAEQETTVRGDARVHVHKIHAITEHPETGEDRWTTHNISEHHLAGLDAFIGMAWQEGGLGGMSAEQAGARSVRDAGFKGYVGQSNWEDDEPEDEHGHNFDEDLYDKVTPEPTSAEQTHYEHHDEYPDSYMDRHDQAYSDAIDKKHAEDEPDHIDDHLHHWVAEHSPDANEWRKHAKQPQNVDLRKGVYATQSHVGQFHIDRYLHGGEDEPSWHSQSGGHTGDYLGESHPLFVTHHGRLHAIEGHHRVAAALQRGDSHIQAWHHDLDQHPEAEGCEECPYYHEASQHEGALRFEADQPYAGGHTFEFKKANPREMGGSSLHELTSYAEGATFPSGKRLDSGSIRWSHKSGEIAGVDVRDEYRRQGLGTELLNRARDIAANTRGVVAPKHSVDRTDEGDAWARSTGDRLPRRKDRWPDPRDYDPREAGLAAFALVGEHAPDVDGEGEPIDGYTDLLDHVEDDHEHQPWRALRPGGGRLDLEHRRLHGLTAFLAALGDDADADNLYPESGSHHTSIGRYLPGHKEGIAGDPDWEERWNHVGDVTAPAQVAQQGASDYRARLHLPHQEMDYSKVMADRDRHSDIADAYDKAGASPEAIHSYHAMIDGVRSQYHHLTHNLGINVEVTPHDPYKDHHEMIHDVNQNKRLRVLSTATTGSSPLFSDEDNDKFRAVHDFFGHAATGRSFDRHGEEAAWLHHGSMFSPEARGALTTETRGQNASLIHRGSFPTQKLALLPDKYWDDKAFEAVRHRYAALLAFLAAMEEDEDYAHANEDDLDQIGDSTRRSWGANDLDTMFGGSPTTPAPFRSAGGRRDIKSYDEDLVHEHLRRGPADDELKDFDPRKLKSTQPAVTRSGVEYYLGHKYHETGETYANQDNPGNKHPVVYSRPKMVGGGREHLLLSGHHRASAALLRGETLRVHHIIGPWGPPR
jgi:8-oxo-dGTP pyrophosphatase MutT (NUDIX family)/GNAT superfamily N-acetyltransferase